MRNQALSLNVSALVLHKLPVLYLPAKPLSLAQDGNLCTEELVGVHWGDNSSLKPCLARKSPPRTSSALEMHFDQSS